MLCTFRVPTVSIQRCRRCHVARDVIISDTGSRCLIKLSCARCPVRISANNSTYHQRRKRNNLLSAPLVTIPCSTRDFPCPRLNGDIIGILYRLAYVHTNSPEKTCLFIVFSTVIVYTQQPDEWRRFIMAASPWELV